MSKSINLNRKLVLETPIRTKDGSGGYRTSWSFLGTVWASLTALSSQEQSGFGGDVSQVHYKFIIRSAPIGSCKRPNPSQRFLLGERIFLITSVSEYDVDGQYLQCFSFEETIS